MYPKLQTFFVLGLSRSGLAASQYLLNEGAKVYVYDDVQAGVAGQNKQMLCAAGAVWVEKEDLPSMARICDALVLSPGIAIDHPIAVAFKRAQKAVLGESELASRCLSVPFVAVTGTNGKTTTVSMIADALNADGKKAFACGNIGLPMIQLAAEKPPFFAVAEISSFQLETLNSFRPHIAVVLNIAQDHLNRHYNMENYVFLKAKLLKNLTETEYAVLNYDDDVVREFAENTKAKVLYFSTRTKTEGAYCLGEDLYYGEEKITSAEKLFVGGIHNVQNALAAICVAKLLGVDSAKLAEAIENFKGVSHRVEKVAVVDGVTYIDDSKGTNAAATIKAIGCVKGETVLLLGGKEKGQGYDELFSVIKNSSVVHTVLYGENRFRLIDGAEKNGWTNVTLCTGFDCAVRFAKMLAKSGQNVLLSPASASFDEFVGYEERGERFVKIVEEFQKENAVSKERADDDEDRDGQAGEPSLEEME